MVEDELLETIKSLLYQFAYHTSVNGKPALTAGGLSALEEAFEVVGWEDPYICPELGCQVEGCGEIATCGIPTPDGYKTVCSEDYRRLNNERG